MQPQYDLTYILVIFYCVRVWLPSSFRFSYNTARFLFLFFSLRAISFAQPINYFRVVETLEQKIAHEVPDLDMNVLSVKLEEAE